VQRAIDFYLCLLFVGGRSVGEKNGAHIVVWMAQCVEGALKGDFSLGTEAQRRSVSMDALVTITSAGTASFSELRR
jgi:hypothetical protein